MQSRDLMRRPVAAVRTDSPVGAAANLMGEKNIGFLPVVNATGRVVGALTDRDLAIHVLGQGRDPQATRVIDVMTREAVTCHLSDSVERVERLMRQRHKSRIIVTDDDGELAGVISLSDITTIDRAGAAETLATVAEREILDPSGRPAPI